MPQDLATHEQPRETLALLEILALGGAQVEAGKVRPAGDALRRLRNKHQA